MTGQFATKLLLLFQLVAFCFCDGYDDYNSSNDTTDQSVDYVYNETETDYPPYDTENACPEKELEKVFNDNEDALVKLFGSPQQAKTKVILPILEGTKSYWTYDQAFYSIEQALDPTISSTCCPSSCSLDTDTDNVKSENGIKNVSLALRTKMMQERSNSCMLCDMNAARYTIDCVLGRQARNHYFNLIENSFGFGDNEDKWLCEPAIPLLWKKLINANYSNEDCSNNTLEKALKALVEVENESQHYREGYSTNKKLNKIKLDLLKVLSKRDVLQFLEPVLCGEVDLELCSDFSAILCDVVRYAEVKDISHKIEYHLQKSTVRSPAEIRVLLQVHRSLGRAANELSKSIIPNAPLPKTDDVDAARDMLESYFGIVDSVIGTRSVNTWKQEADKENALQQFKQTLLENENFAGYASDMILARHTRDSDVVIPKETLNVKMKKIFPFSNRVEFAFDDATIQMNFSLHSNSSNDEFNAFALYYKSWLEVLESISDDLIIVNDNTTKTSSGIGRVENKTFVGKGGIISISLRKNQEKISIPVTYNIAFDPARMTNGNITRRCLSCGYLNSSTLLWESNGCNVIAVTDEEMTCYCSHTTNFAGFMSPFQAKFNLTETEKLILNIFEYTGSILSVICLFLSLMIFCIVRHHIKHDRLRAHMNLALALLFVHFIQIFAELAVNNNTLCIITTVSTHYFLLVAFMWMLIEGIFLYIYVIQVFMLSKIESRQWMYLFGWLLPAVIVAISAGYGLPNEIYIQPLIHPTDDDCEEGQMLYPPANSSTNSNLKYLSCQLSTESGMIWAFIGPAMAVIVFNIGILIKVVMVLVKLTARSKEMKNFKTSSHSYPNQAYGSKSKPSISLPKSSLTPIHSEGASASDETSLTHDSLHGMATTQTNSTSRSQSSYVHMRPTISLFASSSERDYFSDVKTAVKGAVVLLPLLGIPWIIGMLGSESFAFQLIFVIINSIQGVAIFLIYCCFNKEVSRALRRSWRIFQLNRYPADRVRTTSSSSLKSISTKRFLNKRRSTEVLTISK